MKTKVNINPLSNKISIFTATTVKENPRNSLDYTLSSLYKYTDLDRCKHIIGYDIWNEPKNVVDGYNNYIRSLRDKYNPNIKIFNKSKCGLGGMVLSMLDYIDTPYIFMVEHDWLFIKNINFKYLIDKLDKYQNINYLRIISKTPLKFRYNYDSRLVQDKSINDIPLTKVWCYSGNPHIVRKSFLENNINTINNFTTKKYSGKTYEGAFTTAYRNDVKTMGYDDAHKKWGIYIYGYIGDPPYTLHEGKVQ